MHRTIVMIDFENVQPDSVASLAKDSYEVRVFVGAAQPKLPFALADAMQRMGSRAEYVRISGAGRNALDFHIAYYIGKLASADPTAHFVIVSADTGFDPLIKHLKSTGITATRSKTVPGSPKQAAKPAAKQAAKPTPTPAKKQKQPTAPAAKATAKVKPAKRPTPDQRAREFMAMMQPANAPRPRSEKSLSSALCSHFHKISDQEAAAVVASMYKSGFIKMSDGVLLYAIESA